MANGIRSMGWYHLHEPYAISHQPSALSHDTDLVSDNAEIALLPTLGPRTRQASRVGADVLELAVDHVTDGAAGGVLPVGFDVHRPGVGNELHLLHRDRLRTGIDGAREGLAVPVELEQDVRAVLFRRSPIAAPRAFERVTELRQRRRRHQQHSQRPRQATERDLHREFLPGALLYTDWN